MSNVLINILSSDVPLEYRLFREYCSLKEKGLRKQSFVVLQAFIDEANHWNAEKQQEFVIWFFGIIEDSENIHHVLVYPLEENLLKPILKCWMGSSNDSRPYRWYGMFLNSKNQLLYLQKAIELGGYDDEQSALNKVIDMKFYSLWYSFHHISENTYLGELKEDQKLLKEIRKLMVNVLDEEIKSQIKIDLDYYNNLINDWIEFNNHKEDNFVEWCKERNRNYVWVKSFYYANEGS
ncbi:hypothetical protein [Paenibacillus sp. SN-8-1]|uniref:hypothetical protein n=1 Tax=Paenibacillus sp. SN-8-1 TaxID=3435409 RepID=UPI003D9A37B4